MAKTSGLVLLALCMTCLAFLWQPVRATAAPATEEVNPCRSATLTASAGDSYLDLVYHVSLSNPTGKPADVMLLVRTEVLEKVEGVTGDLVVNRLGSALMASVPSGWSGELVIRTKSPITEGPVPGWRMAVTSLPPAVSRSAEFDLPGGDVRLAVLPPGGSAPPIVTSLGTEGGRSRFRVVPLSGELFVPTWASLPQAPPAGYSLREMHRLTEDAPAYSDDVTLEFTFPGALPATVRAKMPKGVTISDLQVSDAAPWKIVDGLLEVTMPDHLPHGRLTVQCHLDGAATPDGPSAQLLAVPLFGSPDAERRTGSVTVNGTRHELAFAALDGARQTAAAQGSRLTCEFEGAAVTIAVRVVPMPVRRVASVETHYAVSEYRVVGTHRVSLRVEGEPATALTLVLPPATTARAVTGDVREWSQEGGQVRIELAAKPGAAPLVEVTTESLTGGKLKLELAPPTVAEATSSDYSMAVTHEAEVLLKTAQAEAPWRVTPEALPDWLRQMAPPVAYHYRDSAPAVELEALPVEADLRGTVQDHVNVTADRIQRDTLFLVDIQKRALQQIELLLPPGLTPESIEGPYVESWDIAPAAAGDPTAGARVIVRFPNAVTGGIHLRLVSSAPASAGPLSLRGIRMSGAPALHGWIGIGTDVSTRVRPVAETNAHLASVRTDQAPAYLAAFGNHLVYEFYSTDWQLDLAAEAVPAVYDAEVLNVLSFSASGVEASAFVKIDVTQGGVAELELRVPAGAATPQVDAPDAVMVRWSEGAGLVRFRGPRSGAFALRVDYALPTGAAASDLTVEPVRVTGARQQSGVLLLVQARPDVDVRAAQPPRALQPAEAEQQYPGWSYQREHPALGAYAYRDPDWKLPVAVAAHPLSEQMLQAIIPLAKLDTIVQDGGETVNHLRLFVTNTTQQFLTVDLAKLDPQATLAPQARLIGTYVYGEPVKPFRQGKTVLEIPLFASETAARVGMSVIDITYAAPTSSLATLSRSSFELPDLGLNVGKVEWTVRLPQDYRLTDVGGNLDKPVAGPPPVRGLAARLVASVVPFVHEVGPPILSLVLVFALIAGFFLVLHYTGRLFKRRRWALAAQAAIVIAVVVAVVAMMPHAMERARRESLKSNEKNNLHQIGVALNMYANNHNGIYPADLGVLSEEGYLGSPDLLKSPNGPDIQLVYRRPAPNPAPAEAIAYFLRPDQRGANVLYADGSVGWADMDADGNVPNPRKSGEVLATAAAVEGAPTGGRAKGQAFGGSAVGTSELAEALQLGQQMAQGRGAPTANQPVDQRRLNEALLAANEDKIMAATDQYAHEHAGQQPATGQDLSSYIADTRLRQAVRDMPGPMPVLELARSGNYKQSSEAGNLHTVGLGVSMYRQDHNGEYPPDLEAVAKDYVPDRSSFASPRGPDSRLVYTPPAKDAKPTDVVAYFWDPKAGDARLLFVDGAVQYVAQDGASNIVNPRSGNIVVRAGAEQQVSGDQLARSRYSLGNAYMQRGDYDEAEKQYTDALKLDASNAEAKRGLDQLRALRSEVKGQEQAEIVAKPKAPASPATAPAAESVPTGVSPPPEVPPQALVAGKKEAAKTADLKSIENQLEQQEMNYRGGGVGGLTAGNAGPQGGVAGRPSEEAGLPAGQRVTNALTSPELTVSQSATFGLQAAAQEEPAPLVQPRLGKASLVRQVAGGRSIGALPIQIDFPAPASVSYEFVKPFLGRADATLSFRVLRTGSVMLLELILAVAALVGYGLVRRRAPGAGAAYAAIVLAVAFAGMAAAPATFASAFGAAALTMGICLAAEVIHLTFLHIHAMRTGS